MATDGSHDHFLVLLSVVIAAAASYTALDLASRVRAATGWVRHAWLGTAAVAMGGGIWSMHFVAMLAFSMPGMEVSYDPTLTVLSLLLAVGVTGAAFAVVSRSDASTIMLGWSGLFMGLGIAGMHYVGMAAMRMRADLRYESIWVAVAILIAIGASTTALWLAFRYARAGSRIVAALVMGVAVAGMHYAAMQGSAFHAHAGMAEAQTDANLDQIKLALAVATTTFVILFLASVAAMFDRRFAVLAEREAEALRQSEERYRTLYSRTPLPLHSLDSDGQIEQVSEAWLDLLGYTRKEVIGRPLINFMTEASARQRMQEDWPRLIREGTLKQAEYRFVTKAGEILEVVVSGRAEYDHDGAFTGALGGVVDVTARKRAEEALRQAQKMEAVGQLTGGVAHDFNNLLAVVIGNLDLLRKRVPDDPRLRRLLDNAAQGAQRGAALTQRMLAFARRQDLKPEAVDIASLVQGMADLLQRAAGPAVHIEEQFPSKLRAVQVDANQLELALINLAVNARDAMPNGGTITLAAREEHADPETMDALRPGDYVCLSVSDTGEGMDTATLARAREPFFTTKGVGKGTGLGLSMVHGLAEQSGGRLVLSSEKGKGTTAEIWLPLAEEGASTARPADATESEATASAYKSLRVLVVDDDALVLANTAEMLEDLGHTVVQAASGREALNALRHRRDVDLIITDHAMPEMTGVQLAAAIRADRPDLPIILASGYTDLPEGTGSGLPRLNKPFSQTALKRAVGEQAQAIEEQSQVIPFPARQG
ncbi:MHYT domain-containing protein [Methylobacterium durans]|uniref:histidine kinase n=1 Tax=Methylobacterium durans TaxID=2202825 RepID=A0A2U8WAJ9_9HYPH|nr:MHYT domain-containing protein [Methylobacterium durans]AWN42638.1 sensor histidine kinase [Methylobacterium durans]